MVIKVGNGHSLETALGVFKRRNLEVAFELRKRQAAFTRTEFRKFKDRRAARRRQKIEARRITRPHRDE